MTERTDGWISVELVGQVVKSVVLLSQKNSKRNCSFLVWTEWSQSLEAFFWCESIVVKWSCPHIGGYFSTHSFPCVSSHKEGFNPLKLDVSANTFLKTPVYLYWCGQPKQRFALTLYSSITQSSESTSMFVQTHEPACFLLSLSIPFCLLPKRTVSVQCSFIVFVLTITRYCHRLAWHACVCIFNCFCIVVWTEKY